MSDCTALLKFPNPLGDGIRAQSDAVGKVLIGNPSVLFQYAEDIAVDRINHGVFFVRGLRSPRNNACTALLPAL